MCPGAFMGRSAFQRELEATAAWASSFQTHEFAQVRIAGLGVIDRLGRWLCIFSIPPPGGLRAWGRSEVQNLNLPTHPPPLDRAPWCY